MFYKITKTVLISTLLLSAAACDAFQGPEISVAKSDQLYHPQLFAEGVNVPWGMAQLPDGDILVTDRQGELKLITDGKMLSQNIDGLPDIYVSGQGGLLDITLHPDYANNGWIYMTYSSPEGEGDGGNTALMRAKFNKARMALSEQQVLYKGSDNTTKGQHFGSRIAFDKKGYVYFSIGDRGARDIKPQSLSLDGGKIYRLHEDGRIPTDNPFVSQKGAKPAVFTYGHRNPQGMAMHPETGEIWSHEHGPRGGDEVNLIKSGNNYGWPEISYGVNYSGTTITEFTEKPGMEQPLHYWDPSIAPSGMVFVTSDKYPHWQGKVLIGSLKFHYLVLLDITNDSVTSQRKLFEGIGRVRSLLQGNDGYLYVGVDGGGIKRIEPKN